MELGKRINIILGYGCNYRCKHCSTSSGPDKKDSRLSESEIQDLCKMVQNRKPDLLLFTGGEPTLYPEIINRIVKSHPIPDQFRTLVTSNGWYGTSEQNVKKILDQINRIDVLQMSFDVFHGNESKISYVKNIANYCKERKVEFAATMCLSTPMDLVKAKSIINDLDVPVAFQVVISTGRALENKLTFPYATFQQETLDKKCPNSATVVYVPQRGFSICPNNLVYGKSKVRGIVHRSIDEHAQSEFYKDISSLTMRELAVKRDVDVTNLPAHLSHVCHLCEYIHTNGQS